MKSRFPSDVLVIIFGPLLIVAIALGLRSFIYHAEQLRGTVTGYICGCGRLLRHRNVALSEAASLMWPRDASNPYEGCQVWRASVVGG
jgi:hypothetical protein